MAQSEEPSMNTALMFSHIHIIIYIIKTRPRRLQTQHRAEQLHGIVSLIDTKKLMPVVGTDA